MTNDCLHSELTRLSATLWECAERDCMFAIRLPQPATSADREVPGSQVEPLPKPDPLVQCICGWHGKTSELIDSPISQGKSCPDCIRSFRSITPY